jgi:hypothetical protein
MRTYFCRWAEPAHLQKEHDVYRGLDLSYRQDMMGWGQRFFYHTSKSASTIYFLSLNPDQVARPTLSRSQCHLPDDHIFVVLVEVGFECSKEGFRPADQSNRYEQTTRNGGDQNVPANMTSEYYELFRVCASAPALLVGRLF